MSKDANPGSPDRHDLPEVEPEIFVDGNGSVPGGAGRDRSPMRPGTRQWIAVGIAIVLVFFIGIAAGSHFGGGRSEVADSPGGQSDMSAPTRTTASLSSSSSDSSRSTAPEPSADGTASAASAPAGPEPHTAALVDSPLPGSSRWELVGVGPSSVVRYEPSTGMLTSTAVPAINSTGPLSVAFTGNGVIIRPWDYVPGYLVTDGQPAVELEGALATGALVFPGADTDHVWVSADDRKSLHEVDADGTPTGTVITIPGKLQIPFYALAPDGAGYILGRGLDGAYDLRPDAAHLVTHGQVLAAGPTRYLVDHCDDPTGCGTTVINRDSGPSRPVPSSDSITQGVVSPDGNFAATGTAELVTLTNLTTGDSTTMPGSIGSSGTDQLPRVAFTPDSLYLLVATADGVVPIDTATLTALPPLPIPHLVAIATRPTS